MAPSNVLPIHGNEKTMNLNNMVLTNIQSSPYFKVQLFELKTYHEVLDEIYYKVAHLEPWEKGSRKTAGQTGMCGGVRGVGAGGIVSSAFCLLYKLFTLRLTRKQLNGLITHSDSPYLRGLGFLYIRYTQPPADLWEWLNEYLNDDEEIDVKAGGGHVITVGFMIRQFLTKLDWYGTLFPRIPVPIQKKLEVQLKEHDEARRQMLMEEQGAFNTMETDVNNAQPDAPKPVAPRDVDRRPTPPFDIAKEFEKAPSKARPRSRSRERERKRSRSRERRSHERKRSPDRHRDRHRRDRSRDRERSRDKERSRDRDRSRDRERSRDVDRHRDKDRTRDRERDRSRDRSRRDKSRDRSRDRKRHKEHRSSFEKDLQREKERVEREKDKKSRDKR